MKFRNIRKNVKAISPVISVLLMIAVAVVASLVAYAWVMGYIGFQTAKTGQAIQIQSVSIVNGTVNAVYVQNVGDGAVTFIPAQCLYIEGVQSSVTNVTINGVEYITEDALLLKGETATIFTSTGDFNAGQVITIKVTTEGGTYSQVSQVVPDDVVS